MFKKFRAKYSKTAGAGMEYDSFNYMSGSANISGPVGPVIKDTRYLGINGRYARDDGWIENDYPGMDKDASSKKEYNFNTSFLYTPTDRFKARLSMIMKKPKEDHTGLRCITLPGLVMTMK